ncbi:tRNA(Ile)-lysidine synthase [Filimonas zeae]|uniref:tRNA(Ile)-lysidine synthase n=1 Tax=Filimonas zeae TaxID=1737353 RepID=A0A917ILL4_9BACT|nr:tRNA lysidine(34) synthetase TilS [Filimonas zeae]MDR6337335.1 tRNA(Ile)-lysidine synthase [Filimonas zeae]GGH58108.1 tRNA(Ile)-lysidine synthase [Filimonas zeae]
MNQVAARFQQYWKKHFNHLPAGNTHVILAVSGGIDSVVLAHLLHTTGITFSLAHGNFGLRGEESERDEAFVRNMGVQYGVEVHVQRFATAQWTQQQKVSIQEAARILRYTWFEQIWSRLPHAPRAVATAHHANDSMETLLMNFFRGTGISGLHGIQPVQGHIIRPLLFATRQEISSYAVQHQLQWVEDSSNASDKYTRNYFRLQLIPGLQQVFPEVEENLLQNIERFTEVEMLYRQAVSQQLEKLVEQKGAEQHIPIYKLLKATPLHTLLWEMIRPFQFTAAQTEEVKKLLTTGGQGSYITSATHRIIKNRNWLIIAPVKVEEAEHIIIEDFAGNSLFSQGSIQMQLSEQPMAEKEMQQPPQVGLFDADAIQFPLLLRPWKTGDYFYPLGMQKKKKINRFLIDLKLSATDKEKTWVLVMNEKIIWVVGRRIDNRFKVTPHTKRVLKLTYTAAK